MSLVLGQLELVKLFLFVKCHKNETQFSVTFFPIMSNIIFLKKNKKKQTDVIIGSLYSFACKRASLSLIHSAYLPYLRCQRNLKYDHVKISSYVFRGKKSNMWSNSDKLVYYFKSSIIPPPHNTTHIFKSTLNW